MRIDRGHRTYICSAMVSRGQAKIVSNDAIVPHSWDVCRVCTFRHCRDWARAGSYQLLFPCLSLKYYRVLFGILHS